MMNAWLLTDFMMNFNPISRRTHYPPNLSNWPLMWVLWSWFYAKWIVIRLYWICYYYCYFYELNMNYGGMIQGDHSLKIFVSWSIFLFFYIINDVGYIIWSWSYDSWIMISIMLLYFYLLPYIWIIDELWGLINDDQSLGELVRLLYFSSFT